MVNALTTAALTLAHYQDGVGFQPLTQLGVDLTKLDLPKTDDALDKLANEMVQGGDIERYNAFYKLVEKDTAEILKKLDKAKL